MEKQTDIRAEAKEIISLYNNDNGILDFLADLKDREPIHSLERYVSFSHRDNACLLFNCKPDNLFVLVLYNAPFTMCNKDNKLMVYAHPELNILCRYFKAWISVVECSNFENKENISKALNDILRLLYYNWALGQDPNEDNTQMNFLG